MTKSSLAQMAFAYLFVASLLVLLVDQAIYYGRYTDAALVTSTRLVHRVW